MLTEHEKTHVKLPRRYVPPFPERSGYHWVRRYHGAPCIPLHWFADWHRNGGEGWGQWAEPDREHQWEYCGPCPVPHEPPADPGSFDIWTLDKREQNNWIKSADGQETVREDSDAVIRRLGADNNWLRAILYAADQTLTCHGKIDADTNLHHRIRDAISPKVGQ